MYPHALKTFDLTADARTHRLDMQVTRGATVEADVVGPDGQAPDTLIVAYQGVEAPYDDDFEGDGREIFSGRLKIDSVPPDGDLKVFLLDPVKKHGRVVTLRGREAERTKRIELLPCGSAKYRMVDAQGNPVPGVDNLGQPNMIFLTGTSLFDRDPDMPLADETHISNFDRRNHWGAMSGEGGWLTCEALIPGVEYQLFGDGPDGKPQVERSFQVGPGEQKTLADYVIRDQEVLDRAERNRKNQPNEQPILGLPVTNIPPPNDDLVTVRGTVLDPDGKPVEGAEVSAIAYQQRFLEFPEHPFKPPAGTSRTDATGHFEVSFRKSQSDRGYEGEEMWNSTTIIARQPGFGAAFGTYGSFEDANAAMLRLVADQPIHGRIVDLEGRPVAGATLELGGVGANREQDLSRWISAVRDGVGYYNSQEFGRPSASHIAMRVVHPDPIRTDADGRFTVTGIGGQRYALFRFTAPGMAVSKIHVVTVPVEPFRVDYGSAGFKHIVPYYGSDFQFAAEPSQPIEGVVRNSKTKQPLAGATVVLDKLAGTMLAGVKAAETVSDEQGRYRLDGMPRGEGNRILVLPPEDKPYFARYVDDVPISEDFSPVTLDLEIQRGLWITGRVSEQETGRPIQQARVWYYPWPNNPHLGEPGKDPSDKLAVRQGEVRTDADGRYRVVGLPGRGLVAAWCPSEPYPQGQGVPEIADLPSPDEFYGVVNSNAPTNDFPTIVREIHPSDDDHQLEVDLQIQAGRSLPIRVVDPDGQPLTEGLMIQGLWPKATRKLASGAGRRERDNPGVSHVLGLKPNERRSLLLHDKKHQLGKVLDVGLADLNGEALTITLEPCIVATGRLLDAAGDPLRTAKVRASPSSEHEYGHELPWVFTNDNGVFEYTLLPGCKYGISCDAPQVDGLKSVARDLEVSPGETIDLGEFDVTSKERPEPKRTLTQTAAKQPVGEQTTNANPLVVRGTVVDPDGKPAAKATVKLIRSHTVSKWVKEVPNVETATDAAGRFELVVPKVLVDGWRNGRPWPLFGITVNAAGFAKSHLRMNSEQETQDAVVRMTPFAPLEGRIVNLEGQPVPGVSVRLHQVDTTDSGDLEPWLAEIRKGTPSSEVDESIRPGFGWGDDELRKANMAVTDADGRFRLSHVGRNHIALLKLSGGGIAATTIEVANTPLEPISRGEHRRKSDSPMLYGSPLEYAAEPAAPIVGVVRNAKTGEPIPGVKISSRQYEGLNQSGWGLLESTSDEQGRYRLEGMPRGTGDRIVVRSTGEAAYLVREFEVPQGQGLEPVEFDIELHPGVWIEGRVSDAATGKPAAAKVVYLPWHDNRSIDDLPEFQGLGLMGVDPTNTPNTDADGRFKLIGIPGRGLLEVVYTAEPKYPVGQGFDKLPELAEAPEKFQRLAQLYMPRPEYTIAVQEVNIADEAERVEANFALESGQTVTLSAVDANGTPVEVTRATGLVSGHWVQTHRELGSQIEVAGLLPGKSRPVLLLNAERRLGAMLNLDIGKDGGDARTVTLVPMATIVGRLVDDAGDPLPRPTPRDNVHLQTTANGQLLRAFDASTDATGRFELLAIAGPPAYDVFAEGAKGLLAEKLEVAAGETIDLGTIDGTSKQRPPIKRTPAAARAKPQAGEQVDRAKLLVVRGTVLDPDGKPAAGTNVRLIGVPHPAWPKPRPRIDQTTGADGRFELVLPPSVDDKDGKPWPVYGLKTTADGYATDLFWYGKELEGKDVTIKLKPQAPIEGRILNLEGQPIPGVHVHLESIMSSRTGDLSAWLDALRKKTPRQEWHQDWPPHFGFAEAEDVAPYTTQTDADGRFWMMGVGPHQLARLRIGGGGVVASRIQVANASIEPITVDAADSVLYGQILFGSQFEFLAEASQAIVGTVKDAETGVPIAGIRVASWRFAGTNFVGNEVTETASDEKGHYRLEGMPPGKGNEIVAHATTDQPYLTRELEVPAGRGLEPVQFDIQLHRGVIVRGQVRDAVTHEPQQGRLVYLPWPTNPRIENLPEFTGRRLMGDTQRWNINKDGHFTVVGLPGRGLLVLTTLMSENYPRGQGFDKLREPIVTKSFSQISQLYEPSAENTPAILELDIAEDAREATADFELVPGDTISLTAIDTQGRPIEITEGFGLLPGSWGTRKVIGRSTANVLGLRKHESRQVTLVNLERGLGASLQVSLSDPTPRPPVQFEPVATVTGRIVTAQGEPNSWSNIDVQSVGDSPAIVFNSVDTDRDGYFKLQLVATPTPYRIRSLNVRGALVEALIVAPGETIDLGTIDGTSQDRPPIKRTPAAAKADSPAVETSADADNAQASKPDAFEFAGKVVGTDGKPVAGAKVFVIYYTPTHIETKPRATSTADGRFAFTMSKREFDQGEKAAPWQWAFVVATAPGFGLGWVLAAGVETRGEILEALKATPNYNPEPSIISLDSTIRLVADDVPIEGRILNLEGQPVVGARVQAIELHGNPQNSLDAWVAAAQDKSADEYEVTRNLWGGFGGLHLRHWVSQLFPPVVSDAEGRFRIDGVGRERIAMLQIERQGFETRQLNVLTRPGPTYELLKYRRDPNLGTTAYYGAKFDVVVGPSRDVVGMVRDLDTGEPLAGATIAADKLAGNPTSGIFNSYIRTTSDGEGSYRLSGLPIGENRIRALPPADQPYLPASDNVEVRLDREQETVDLKSKRGVWLRGRVTDAASGKPLPANVQYFAFRDNPSAGSLPIGQLRPVITNADGKFAICGLPGRGILGVTLQVSEKYPRGVGAEKIIDGRDENSGVNSRDDKTIVFRTRPSACFSTNFHVLAEVNPAEDAAEFEVDFQLQAGRSVNGTVLDPEGRPLAGALFAGGGALMSWRLPPLKSARFTVENVELNQPRRLSFLHTERRLAGSVLLSGNETGPLEVKLQPWGTVTGRVLQATGEPADDVDLLGLLFGDNAAVANFGLLPDPNRTRTDAKGRFEIEGLAPNTPYALSASQGRRILGAVIEQFQLAPGETKDLGDLTIHSPGAKAKPEPGDKKQASNPSAKTPAEQTLEFTGKVLDPAGKPKVDAQVALLYYDGKRSLLSPPATTGDDGGFMVRVPRDQLAPDDAKWATLIATAEGQGCGFDRAAPFETSGALLKLLESHYRHDEFVARSKDRILRLVADDVPISGRVINLEGQGLVGARVRVRTIYSNATDGLDPWLTAAVSGQYILGQLWKHLPESISGRVSGEAIGHLLPEVVTDAQGRFKLSGVGRERIIELLISADGLETRTLYVRTRNGEAVQLPHDVTDPDAGSETVYGPTFEYALAPSLPLVGVVRDVDSGKPLAGVKVVPERIAGERLHSTISYDYLQDTTDNEGRYRLVGLPIGENRIAALPADDQPYLPAAIELEADSIKQENTLDFALKRGVWIRGRASDAQTGEPIKGNVQYLAYRDNPNLRAAPGLLGPMVYRWTDDNGRYQVVGLPGHGLVTLLASDADDKYPRGAGRESITIEEGSDFVRTQPFLVSPVNAHYLAELNIDAAANTIERDIQLHVGSELHGTVLDPEGKPLTGGRCAGLTNIAYWNELDDEHFSIHHLEHDQKRRIYFYHEARDLAGSIEVSGNAAGPIVVKLQPAGVLKGRVLFDNGDPAEHVELHGSRGKNQDLPRGILGRRAPLTDRDGKFTISGLAPGLFYSLHVIRGSRLLGTPIEDVTVGPGETKDLGDLTIPVPEK